MSFRKELKSILSELYEGHITPSEAEENILNAIASSAFVSALEEDLKGRCYCACHRNPYFKHLVPCCDKAHEQYP